MKQVKRVLVAAFVALTLLSACGNDDQTNDKDREQIQQCVRDGGNPLYSQSQSGWVYFITCQPKKV